MFCHNCGHQLPDEAAFCTACGANLKTHSQAPSQAQHNIQPTTTYLANATPTNTIAIVGFILSFFIALAGLICSIVGYNNAKKGAPYKGLAIAGIVISAVWMGAVFILSIVSAAIY